MLDAPPVAEGEILPVLPHTFGGARFATAEESASVKRAANYLDKHFPVKPQPPADVSEDEWAHDEDLLAGALKMMRLLRADNKITVFDHTRYLVICHLLERERATITHAGRSGYFKAASSRCIALF